MIIKNLQHHLEQTRQIHKNRGQDPPQVPVYHSTKYVVVLSMQLCKLNKKDYVKH